MKSKKGWRNEPLRHSLASKGVKTGRRSRVKKNKQYNVSIEFEDYYGNTEKIVKFKRDKRVNERKIELKGYSYADTEGDEFNQHIRLQREDKNGNETGMNKNKSLLIKKLKR